MVINGALVGGEAQRGNQAVFDGDPEKRGIETGWQGVGNQELGFRIQGKTKANDRRKAVGCKLQVAGDGKATQAREQAR